MVPLAQPPAAKREIAPFLSRVSDLRAALRSLDLREGLSFGWLVVAFCVACVLIILREPGMFTNSQFWAEDGKYWYAQAYNGGWFHSLTIPDGGYLNTLQRLGGGLALLVPFRWAPLTMALFGLFIQALPVPILLSCRCQRWAPLSLRIAFALVYIAITHVAEIHVICTNSHFHLALVELLLAFSVIPRSHWQRAFDVIIFLVAGCSGPFALILLPLLAIFWFVRRQNWSLVQLGLLLAGSIPQVYFLRSFQSTRPVESLGASWSVFVRLLGGDVYLGALHGSVPYGLKYPFVVSLVPFVIGIALCLYCARFSSIEVRLFFLYCYAVFAASLRSPLTGVIHTTAWFHLLRIPASRYWFFPSLPFLFAILWCIWCARSRIMRWTCVILCLFLCQGIYRDWRIHAFVDLDFPAQAARFEAAQPGQSVTIPLNPPPDWDMTLIKK